MRDWAWSQAKWRGLEGARTRSSDVTLMPEVAREREGRQKRTSARITVSEHARGVKTRKRGKAADRSTCCV
eukprot:3932046-Pleurochrysis_carterae.AAC.2